MSRSGDFCGDNRQTDRQTYYFTPTHARGVIMFGALDNTWRYNFYMSTQNDESRKMIKLDFWFMPLN